MLTIVICVIFLLNISKTTKMFITVQFAIFKHCQIFFSITYVFFMAVKNDLTYNATATKYIWLFKNVT